MDQYLSLLTWISATGPKLSLPLVSSIIAKKIILLVYKFYVTHPLITLRWFPVAFRIKSKLLSTRSCPTCILPNPLAFLLSPCHITHTTATENHPQFSTCTPLLNRFVIPSVWNPLPPCDYWWTLVYFLDSPHSLHMLRSLSALPCFLRYPAAMLL